MKTGEGRGQSRTVGTVGFKLRDRVLRKQKFYFAHVYFSLLAVIVSFLHQNVGFCFFFFFYNSFSILSPVVPDV